MAPPPLPPPVHAEAAAPARAAEAVPPAPSRPGFLARARCWLSASCRNASAGKPKTCLDLCYADYDACVAPQTRRDASACATDMMRCRQQCERISAGRASSPGR